MTAARAEDADAIWNRACDPFLPTTHPGDAGLAAVLLCHGMAMKGGLLHAVEGLDPDQRTQAEAGFRQLDLSAAADAVADVARRAASLPADDGTAAEQLEEEANRRYAGTLPEWDDTIDRAFRAHLHRHPEAYAPIHG